MSYRSDLEALAARHDALAAEVATKTRELDGVSRMLDEVKQRAKLPVLPNIRVASPCRADWGAMTGDERVRACGQCNKNVYNLSEMTRDEAEALILAKEGRLCVRYFQRHDGTILLKDCVVGVAQKRKRRVIAAGAAALLAGGGFAAFKLTRPEPQTRPEVLLGEMAETSLPRGGSFARVEEPPPPPRPPVHVEEPVHEMKGQMIMGDYGGPIEEGDVVEQDQTILVAPK